MFWHCFQFVKALCIYPPQPYLKLILNMGWHVAKSANSVIFCNFVISQKSWLDQGMANCQYYFVCLQPPKPEDLCTICFTSGTTGESKLTQNTFIQFSWCPIMCSNVINDVLLDPPWWWLWFILVIYYIIAGANSYLKKSSGSWHVWVVDFTCLWENQVYFILLIR